MGKNKIDLVNLLAKYQNGGNNYNQQNMVQSRKKMQIEESFYGKRTLQAPVYTSNNFRGGQYQGESDPRTQSSYQGVFVGNFKMSAQECEGFLIEIQSQLNKQKKQLSYHADMAFKQITQRFNRNHQKIRKDILELLDHAFRQNQKIMKEELLKQSRNEPSEFNTVKFEIQAIQEQISGFLRQLRSSDYRKAISEVVLKDYSFEMKRLKDTIQQAKLHYIQNLGQIQPDVNRIECLKNDLKSLFYFKKKTAKVIQKSIFSVLAQNTQMSPNYNIQSKYQGPQQQGSRTRKSFFNFGS